MPTKQFIAQQQFLKQCLAEYTKHAQERKTINILGISCSTVNMDDKPPRIPHSESILENSFDYARATHNGVQTKIVKLRDLNFEHCEANYSTDGSYCTRPCRLSQRKKEDELMGVYNLIVDRADIIIIATPIRWGSPASLYYKFIERLNCIENQKEVYGVDLMQHQLVGFVIMGAQDGVQGVLGQMMPFWAQLGCGFAKDPFVGYTAGNFTNTRIDLIDGQMKKDKDIISQQYKTMIDEQVSLIRKMRQI